jgi:hypothetical protein
VVTRERIESSRPYKGIIDEVVVSVLERVFRGGKAMATRDSLGDSSLGMTLLSFAAVESTSRAGFSSGSRKWNRGLLEVLLRGDLKKFMTAAAEFVMLEIGGGSMLSTAPRSAKLIKKGSAKLITLL